MIKNYNLTNDIDTCEVNDLIEICKSSSMIVGSKLRKAHYRLGELIAPAIISDLQDKSLTVFIMLRAGLFFGEGIADKIEELGFSVSIILLDSSELPDDIIKDTCDTNILIVDAVINTGKSIFELTNKLKTSKKILLATTVIPEESLELFSNSFLYCVRTSENKYIGAKTRRISNGKGPDTGDRLFNTLSFR
ncbi:MAG: phosphoribosyl transferase [Spirochaetes bacterium]|nr:phosphoribosyl transferase [Spirochaetota bacterium]